MSREYEPHARHLRIVRPGEKSASRLVREKWRAVVRRVEAERAAVAKEARE
jgi:hypothetical protein